MDRWRPAQGGVRAALVGCLTTGDADLPDEVKGNVDAMRQDVSQQLEVGDGRDVEDRGEGSLSRRFESDANCG